MNCLHCNDLTRVFEVRSTAYVKARAAPFYRVCTELAAKKLVDMERARTDLAEHRLVCHFVRKSKGLSSQENRNEIVSQAAPLLGSHSPTAI